MRMKKPRVASLDEVRITRDGEAALIEFADETIGSTRLGLGPKIKGMTDAEILESFNEWQRAMEYSRATYNHVAVEIPVGMPQIEYSAQCDQWTPRGDVLRCVIEDDEAGEAVIHVDDQELSLEKFGRLLRTYAGWGMRIVFVPDDSTHEEPVIEVREPKKGKR
jgi:hypothetical protein